MVPITKYPQLNKSRLPITERKWKDLQSLKSVITVECHSFYDQLPYSKNKTKDVINENDPSEDVEPEPTKSKKTKSKKNC